MQVSRGHRRTDLYDEGEYPTSYQFANGNTVCLPYLASLIRLADEIDVAADRNPFLLYGMDRLSPDLYNLHKRLHEAIRRLEVTPDCFIMKVETEDESLIPALEEQREKMQHTLDYCCGVTEKRSDYRISQTAIRIERTE